jgi:hypothetical protein
MYLSDGSAAQHKRKKLSTSTMNKILVSLLNGTSLQQAIRTDKQMEQDSEKAGCKGKSTESV